MESLDDIIIKRDSWTSMLELLKPYIAPQNWHMIEPAHELWNSIPLDRQRQIWVTLWEKKMRGLKIKDHPYYAIKDCVPMPFNWNGSDHVNSMMKTFKMVSAKYYGQTVRAGVAEKGDARAKSTVQKTDDGQYMCVVGAGPDGRCVCGDMSAEEDQRPDALPV